MPAEPSFRHGGLVAAVVLAGAASLAFVLMVPPIVGLADNGDFERLMRPAGLAPTSETPADRFYSWMQPRFLFGPRTADSSGYRSSESFLLELAVRAGRLFGREPQFDIRFLGAVHAAILLAALGLAAAACRSLAWPAAIATASLLVLFFTDPGYVAPFQSLYSQSASLLFLILVAAIVAHAIRHGRLEKAWLPAYFVCVAVFVCSKPQESVQAVLLAPLGVRLAWNGPRRARLAALVLAVLVCGLAWRYFRSAEASVGWATRYNVLFLETLPRSPDPARDLEELGLDPALARFAGVSAWVPESPARDPGWKADFEKRSRASSPQGLYARHPGRLLALLRRTAGSSYVLPPPDLGNYSKESGAPAGAQSRGPWSRWRRHLSGAGWLVVFLGGTLAAAAATYRRATPRGRLFRESLAVLVAMAAGAFVVSALGDAQIETSRHLFIFQAMCDLILLLDVGWAIQAVSLRA